MSTQNPISRFLNILVSNRWASRCLAGGAGILISLYSLFERLNGVGRPFPMYSAMLAIALALAGFGLGVLVVELGIRVFKNLYPARVKSTSPGLTEDAGVSSADFRRQRTESEMRISSPAHLSARSRDYSMWQILALIALIVGSLLFGVIVFAAKFKNSNQNKRNSVYVTKEEVEQSTNQLNKKLTYLSITKIGKNSLALVNADGTTSDDPIAQYVVSIQNKYAGQVSIFNGQEYVMAGSDPLKLDGIGDLCGTIDKTLEQQDEILKALQDANIRVNLSRSLWGFDAGVEFGPPKAVLVELAAILRKMAGLKAKKVEILIRGYADGQRAPWTARLRQQPYHYSTVNVYLPVETNRLNSFKYVRVETSLPIQENYTNGELPELRARFVKEEFIDKFLEDCKGNTEVEVHILKGYADNSNVIHERDRKAEIFINIY